MSCNVIVEKEATMHIKTGQFRRQKAQILRLYLRACAADAIN